MSSDVDEALPPYRPIPGLPPVTRHSYTSERTAGVSLNMKLHSHAGDANAPPLFFSDGVPIRGKLKVTLAKKIKISAIVVHIRGFQRGIIAGMFRTTNQMTNEEDKDFMLHSITLWSAGASSSGSFLDAGTHRFSFLEALPAHIHSSSKKRPLVAFPLPPTFMPNDFPFSLMYEIHAVVQRGLFQRDERIVVPIRYVTRTYAERPSDLRRLAYEDGSPLWGPHLDPDGCVTTNIRLEGTLFGQRPAQVHCAISVASPTSFPRGYAIPVFVTVRSSDAQALDLATSLPGLVVSLERTFSIDLDLAVPPSFLINQDQRVAQGRFWLVNPQPDRDPLVRTMQGEITAPSNLIPSFACPSFELTYVISFAMRVNGLRAVGVKKDAPVAVVPITITTSPAPGPRPRSYAPPLRFGEEVVRPTRPNSIRSGGSFAFT